MCPVASVNLCGLLEVLIEEHHSKFRALYSSASLTPKFHFLVHYPDQILRIGPLVRSWNMRYEAKLSLFKRASHLGNFKNIAFTLACCHQCLLCYELSTRSFLLSTTECGPSKQSGTIASEPQHIQQSITLLLPGVSRDAPICRPACIKIDGIMIKPNSCYVIIGATNFNPVFGKVIKVLYMRREVLLRIQHYKTEYYDSHFHAFCISFASRQSFIKINYVVHCHIVCGVSYVYVKWYFST